MDNGIDGKDERDILASIRNGKVYADFLIATIHTHQLTFFSTKTNTEVDHDIPEFFKSSRTTRLMRGRNGEVQHHFARTFSAAHR